MPYADNQGVRIHYADVGQGPPLLLYVGFLGELGDWVRDGYVAALRDDYRLLMLDPRGQGASDKPHDPDAYTLDQRVGDVLAVLDAAGVAQATLWAYSAGGYVAFGCGLQVPERFTSLIVGGQHPHASNRERLLADAARLRTGSIADYVADLDARSGPLSPETRARWLASDPLALAAYRTARAAAPDLGPLLPRLTLPTLLYAGERDPRHEQAQQAAAQLPTATFVSLPGLGHGSAFRRGDLVVPHVRAFLAGIEAVALAQV